MGSSVTAPWIRVGLWALVAHGLIVAYATLEPQPDPDTDPLAWSEFVSSTGYLVSHVLGNVVGPVLAVLGTVALGALLASARSARLGLWGMVLTVAAQVLFMVPGVISTFGTPPIGAQYLAGSTDVMELEFSPVLSQIILVSLLLVLAGSVLLGLAVYRSGILPRWAGVLWIAGAVVFYLLGAALGMATTGASLPTQPVGALLLAAASTWIAVSAVPRRRRHATAAVQPA